MNKIGMFDVPYDLTPAISTDEWGRMRHRRYKPWIPVEAYDRVERYSNVVIFRKKKNMQLRLVGGILKSRVSDPFFWEQKLNKTWIKELFKMVGKQEITR